MARGDAKRGIPRNRRKRQLDTVTRPGIVAAYRSWPIPIVLLGGPQEDRFSALGLVHWSWREEDLATLRFNDVSPQTDVTALVTVQKFKDARAAFSAGAHRGTEKPTDTSATGMISDARAIRISAGPHPSRNSNKHVSPDGDRSIPRDSKISIRQLS